MRKKALTNKYTTKIVTLYPRHCTSGCSNYHVDSNYPVLFPFSKQYCKFVHFWGDVSHSKNGKKMCNKLEALVYTLCLLEWSTWDNYDYWLNFYLWQKLRKNSIQRHSWSWWGHPKSLIMCFCLLQWLQLGAEVTLTYYPHDITTICVYTVTQSLNSNWPLVDKCTNAFWTLLVFWVCDTGSSPMKHHMASKFVLVLIDNMRTTLVDSCWASEWELEWEPEANNVTAWGLNLS